MLYLLTFTGCLVPNHEDCAAATGGWVKLETGLRVMERVEIMLRKAHSSSLLPFTRENASNGIGDG